MPLVKALYAFYRQLFETECTHRLVKPIPGGSICPECGYRIQIMWHLLRCRCCGSKRHTKMMPDKSIRPLFKYCQHCGGTDVQLIKRGQIHVYEVPYAVCSKEVDYTEPIAHNVQFRYQQYAQQNPFEPIKKYATSPQYKGDVVEGVVLKKSESIRPGRVLNSRL